MEWHGMKWHGLEIEILEVKWNGTRIRREEIG